MAGNEYKKKMNTGGKLFLPSVSLDCVIFGFHDGQLKVLLLKMRHIKAWSLPGGFILRNEDPADAAVRVLKERTGIDELFLQQFQLFGQPHRSDAALHRESMQKEGIRITDKHWILQRFITIGYYALVEFSQVTPLPDESSEACQWCDLATIPALMMDHLHILNAALQALRLHLNYHPVGYNLLPAVFTMPQLQKLYETILAKKLDRRNFQRKMLAYQVLKRQKEPRQVKASKPYRYSFDLAKYHKALKEGWQGGW